MKRFVMDGYVCGKVETRTTASGKHITTFGVNSPDRRRDDSGEWRSVPQFFDCQMWHRGEHDWRERLIVDKAHLVLEGNPHYEEWERDGQKRRKVVFNCDEVFAIEQASRESSGRRQSSPADASVYDEDIPF